MQEMEEAQVRSLGLKGPLEEGMATHSSILAWRIPWTERGAWQATVRGVANSRTRLSWAANTFVSLRTKTLIATHWLMEFYSFIIGIAVTVIL